MAEQRQVEKRKVDMNRLADQFEREVGEIIELVSVAAGPAREPRRPHCPRPRIPSRRSASAPPAPRSEASANVHSVAAASEELASSIGEITRQVETSARIAGEAVEPGAEDRRPHQPAVAGREPHRRRRRSDPDHRRPDQSAGAERDHRGRARRRSRHGLCRGGLRGEVAGRADREGDRRDQPADHRHPVGDPGSVAAIKEIGATIGRISEISAAIAVRGRAAGRRHAGDLPQRAARRRRHLAGRDQHRRRPARRIRDRRRLLAGAVGRAIARQRKQPPEARGRELHELDQGGVSADRWRNRTSLLRYCERSEAIQTVTAERFGIASLRSQ